MKNLISLDIEVLCNYFLIVIKGLKSGKVLELDMYGADAVLSREQKCKLNYMLSNYTSFGFNSINYDMPLINLALTGANCKRIYEQSKDIIDNGRPSWMSYSKMGIEPKHHYDHFDLQEPAPAVMISLKNYGTRIGSKKLQEFYLDPHKPITKDEVDALKKYCINDVDVTIDLYNSIKDRIDLRIEMGKEYGLDLRSKSDPQVAEVIFKKELGVSNPPKSKVPKTITYKSPDFIEFKTPALQELHKLMETTPIEVNQGNGQPKLPKEWNKFIKPKIGNTVYKIGLGGIHSQEKSLVVEADEEYTIRNADIASMYPSVILELGLYPLSLGKKFLDAYRKIYDTRLEAKLKSAELKAQLKKLRRFMMRTRAEIEKEIAEVEKNLHYYETVNKGLKIFLTGSYGKFGSKYSYLYAPHLMLNVTLTGQLMMLMLIEDLEAKGFEVISSNTDGIEVKVKRTEVDLFETIVFDWELLTGMNMEHGEYKGLYAKDVNNYVALYDGYVKSKGLYGETTLSKGRSTPIVFEAIREFILNGTSLETTIKNCLDINQFVSARTVKGGAVWRDDYLGKMVRWYYSFQGSSMHYKPNGNLVPKTAEGNGVKPMMDLTDTLPLDLDYEWYISEAESKLADLGVE